jgi:hypothetical protein
VNLDGILSQSFVIEGIAVFGEIDVLERADDEADVLWQDGCIAGEARCFSCRVGGVKDLYN